MNRFLLGAAIGAALVYFLDVERGESRRQRAADFAGQYINADTMDQAREAGRSTINQARSLTSSVGSQVSQMRNRHASTGDLTATDSSVLTPSNS